MCPEGKGIPSSPPQDDSEPSSFCIPAKAEELGDSQLLLSFGVGSVSLLQSGMGV